MSPPVAPSVNNWRAPEALFNSPGLPLTKPGIFCPTPPRVTERPSAPAISSCPGAGRVAGLVQKVIASRLIRPSMSMAGNPFVA